MAGKSFSLLTSPYATSRPAGLGRTRAWVSWGTNGGVLGKYGPMGVARAGRLCTRIRALLYEGGKLLEVPAGTDAETATLLWLMGALERAREEGHERLVGYLEAVADDVVFEAEAAARGAGG